MRGVVFLGDRRLELREFPDPTPGPGEVVLAIKASGMCGSDLHTYRAKAGQPPSVFVAVLSQSLPGMSRVAWWRRWALASARRKRGLGSA